MGRKRRRAEYIPQGVTPMWVKVGDTPERWELGLGAVCVAVVMDMTVNNRLIGADQKWRVTILLPDVHTGRLSEYGSLKKARKFAEKAVGKWFHRVGVT